MDPRAETPRHHTGCLTLVLVSIIILIPVVGDIVCTVFIVTDDFNLVEKILWILACWLTPWVGRAFYLLVGQRRNRLLSA